MATIVTIDGIPVYQALVESEGDTGMLRISLVDDPAVQSDFLAFKNGAGRKVLSYAVQDEEKRLVLGVVMRADFPIYRRDEDGFEYYIIYKADTIRTMAEKYLAENRQNLVNLMHEDGTDQEGIQMVQYFIKDTDKGMAPAGFEVADGSLLAEFHVTNDEVWDAIKAGTYKGFSLEGIFDLRPETDAEAVQSIVDTLEGKFKTILKNNKMAKLKGLLARLAKAIVNLGNITTDKGVLSWDGDEDLKAGDAVYIEDQDGNRTPAADGDYKTEDGKTIVVENGTVSEIRDPEAEVAPAEPAPAPEDNAKMVQTDKGVLSWDNEDEDLKEGDAVYVTDEEGNRQPAPDGDYTTEDGKVITVADGKVASITDPKAEVSEEGKEQKPSLFQRVREAFEETYTEKMQKIWDAISALGFEGWLVEAGDDFAILSTWSEHGEIYNRFTISWDADGNAIASNPVKVVPAFVTPEEREAADAAFSAIKKDYEKVKAELEKMQAIPAAKPAHEDFNEQNPGTKTGVKGLDNLSRIMGAK